MTKRGYNRARRAVLQAAVSQQAESRVSPDQKKAIKSAASAALRGLTDLEAKLKSANAPGFDIKDVQRMQQSMLRYVKNQTGRGKQK